MYRPDTHLCFNGSHYFVDRLILDNDPALIAFPVRGVGQRLRGEEVADRARQTLDAGHVGPQLRRVVAAPALTVKEPVFVDVVATPDVA